MAPSWWRVLAGLQKVAEHVAAVRILTDTTATSAAAEIQRAQTSLCSSAQMILRQRDYGATKSNTPAATASASASSFFRSSSHASTIPTPGKTEPSLQPLYNPKPPPPPRHSTIHDPASSSSQSHQLHNTNGNHPQILMNNNNNNNNNTSHNTTHHNNHNHNSTTKNHPHNHDPHHHPLKHHKHPHPHLIIPESATKETQLSRPQPQPKPPEVPKATFTHTTGRMSMMTTAEEEDHALSPVTRRLPAAAAAAATVQSVMATANDTNTDTDMEKEKEIKATVQVQQQVPPPPLQQQPKPNHDHNHHSYNESYHDSHNHLKEGRPVPSTRIRRAAEFAQLGVGLAWGTAVEGLSRMLPFSRLSLSPSPPQSPSLLDHNNTHTPPESLTNHHASPSSFSNSSNSKSRRTGSSSLVLLQHDANADLLASTLCRMRGAALKMGQMLSIQDAALVPPTLQRALEQVRKGAQAMPHVQLVQQLESQLSCNHEKNAHHHHTTTATRQQQTQSQQQQTQNQSKDWRDHFVHFDERPFAAASIGQVHRATIRRRRSSSQQQQHIYNRNSEINEDNDRNANASDNGEINDNDQNEDENDHVLQEVVVKVQYPGVGRSIESDLRNLSMLIRWTGFAPPGLFLDNVIRVGRHELLMECDYLREMHHQRRMRDLVHNDPVLRAQRFRVPDVVPHLCTEQILTSEYCRGGTIEQVSQRASQEERNRIGKTILYLTMQELFVWRFMQTDPNWGNFLYDVGTGTTSLIDFGATRTYSKAFVDGYLRMVWASAIRDEASLLDQSYRMGFLTGEENKAMLRAHTLSGYTVGEPFFSSNNTPFDFRGSNISTRMGAHTSVFLQHRRTPPPEEVYTLHRKLAGAYMLCIKLGAVIECRDLLEQIVRNHTFEDGLEPLIV